MYLSPSDLLMEYPKLKQIWTPQDIGYLAKLGLVNCRRDGNKKHYKVLPKDVLRVFEQRV